MVAIPNGQTGLVGRFEPFTKPIAFTGEIDGYPGVYQRAGRRPDPLAPFILRAIASTLARSFRRTSIISDERADGVFPLGGSGAIQAALNPADNSFFERSDDVHRPFTP